MYVFPIFCNDLVKDDIYAHISILIYIISNLWSKTEEEIDIDYIDQLIFVYSILIEEFYPIEDHTPNLHQFAKHLIEMYLNHGKLSMNNAFLFEHLNSVTNKKARSNFGILEQIADKSEILFNCNIKSSINKERFTFLRTVKIR